MPYGENGASYTDDYRNCDTYSDPCADSHCNSYRNGHSDPCADFQGSTHGNLDADG